MLPEMNIYTETLVMYIVMAIGMAVIVYAMKHYEKDK